MRIFNKQRSHLMTIDAYIEKQPAERRQLLTAIHNSITGIDKTVTAAVGEMMCKQMILYHAGVFKYGLSSVKNYISLHAMPVYGSPGLHAKYKALLPKAKFQKGCINFTSEKEMPLAVVVQLITDCAKIDLAKIREAWLAARKK